jgi:hypothetical protein
VFYGKIYKKGGLEVAEFQLGSAFIHVKDVIEVANWYAKLGKSEPHPAIGPVQFMEMRDERGLIIDDNRNNAAGIGRR